MRSMILQAGEIVSGEHGAYRLVFQIGEGGMGEVWEATDLRMSHQVAIKFMRDDGPALRMRFKREANVLRTLSHPNIVRLIDDGETPDGRPFLVLELLTGQTLHSFLRKHGALPVRTALQITRDVVSALAAAHAAGIVHRDLKPANIFLHDSSGTNGQQVDVVVFDFGIAKDLGASGDAHATSTQVATVVGTILGSHGYMSPEQLRGRAVDRRADIWAVGLLLYEMIEGCGLFYGTREQMIRQVLSAPLTPIPWRSKSVAKEIELVIASCLERDLSRRTTSAQELEQRLTQLLDSRSCQPQPASAFDKTEPMRPQLLPPTPPPTVLEDYPPVLAPSERVAPPDQSLREHLAQMQRQFRHMTAILAIATVGTLVFAAATFLKAGGTAIQVMQTGTMHQPTGAEQSAPAAAAQGLSPAAPLPTPPATAQDTPRSDQPPSDAARAPEKQMDELGR